MNILYVRFEDFPYGTAPSFRAFTLSKLLVEAGHTITVLAPNINFLKNEINEDGTYKDIPSIKAISISQTGGSVEKSLSLLLKQEKYDFFMRPTSIKKYITVLRIVKKHGLPIIMDSVEWYDPSNWRLKRCDPRYYLFQYMWHYLFPKCDGVIAISRMIENHYKQSLSNVVRIPTITDVKNTVYRTEIKNERVSFVFSGKLDEGKDNLDTFIEAMDRVDHMGERTQLNIFGPSIEEVKHHLGDKESLLDVHKNNIFIHGRVPQQEAQAACLNSDFSVFFRLNRRSANAGFPTKLGECMTFGTPVICNNTGDISLVVKDRENGFLLNSKSVDEICETLEYLLNMKIEAREAMRRKARLSAEQFFDYHNYISEIKSVFENAVERN